MERAGAAPERVTLAGAFGSHIDPLYAMTLGLIPDCDLAKVASAGNARTGADRAPTRGSRRDRECSSGASTVPKTAIEPDFQRHFVAAMAFPNKEDAFRIRPVGSRFRRARSRAERRAAAKARRSCGRALGSLRFNWNCVVIASVCEAIQGT